MEKPNANKEAVPINAVLQKKMMESAENEVGHMAYKDERYFYSLVCEGALDEITSLFSKMPVEDVLDIVEEKTGRMAKKKLKHFEYAVCSSIALASRAAIEGGMDASTAYALQDAYLQKLENSENTVEMLVVSREAYLDYATRVRDIKRQDELSLYVGKCKSYVANNLNKDFTLGDVAKVIGITKSYLGRLFLKHEGMSVMDYVRRKRVEAAANLLRYSDESISGISAYLCFPSQSHFGMIFKKIMGVTPYQYRKQKRVVDLMR